MNLDQFQKVVQSVRPQLLRVARRMLASSEEAEDAVQEVFIRLWLARTRLSTYENVNAVTVKVLKNICIDKLRKKTLKFDEIEDTSVAAFQQNPHQQIESSENVNLLLNIIQQLPDLQRLIIQMKDVEGYEIEEIIQITQSSAESVRTNLSRARKKVREIFLSEQNR